MGRDDNSSHLAVCLRWSVAVANGNLHTDNRKFRSSPPRFKAGGVNVNQTKT